MNDLASILTGKKPAAPAYDADAIKAKVRAKATEYGMDPDVAERWATQESGFNPRAVSKKGAKGVLQLMDDTAKEMGVSDSYDVDQNIEGGFKYWKAQKDRFGDDERAFAAYNAGPAAVEKAGGVPDFAETKAYVKNIVGGDGNELASVMGAQSVPKGELDAEFAKEFGDPTKWAADAKRTDMESFGTLFKGFEGPTRTRDEGTTPFREVRGVKVPGFLTKDQEALYVALVKGGGYKADDPEGSAYNPYFAQTLDAEKNVPPGSYYVDRDGNFKRAAGGEEAGVGEKVGRGLARGGGDVALSIANLFPGAEDSTIRNRMLTNQKVYDAELKGDTTAALSRFTGQVVASVPALAGAESVIAPTLAKSALGRFAMGEGAMNLAGPARLLGRTASVGTRGAAEGAAAAGLVSSASDAPLSEQLEMGALVGGVLGPLAPAIMGAGRKAGAGARDIFERFSYPGREKAIDRMINEVAPKGVILNTDEIVPGSFPTMAEAAGDAGISALERNARTHPKLAQVFQERLDANANARREFFETVAKDPEAIADAESAREAATAKLRDAAFKGAKEADPAPVVAVIDQVLAGPSGQRDVVVRALSNLREKITAGGGQTDVQQLYGIRKSIGDMLDPLGPSETKGAVLAKRELMEVKTALDKAIEKAAPGFKNYLKTYEEMSKPIDEMKLLQGLKLTDQNGNITLAKLNTAIDKIEGQRKAGGANKAKSVSDDTLKALKALQADLKRASNIMKGKAAGSDTAQNLVMQKFAEGGGIPLGVKTAVSAKVPGGGLILGAAEKAVAGQNEKMLQQLSSRLLEPRKPAKPTGRKKMPSMPLLTLPAVGGVASSSVGSPK